VPSTQGSAYKHIPKNLAPRASVSIALGVWVGSP
jgi:hypothetical protein